MTTKRRVLALSTYPLRVPRHGGQRRCAALGLHYRRNGHQFTFAALVQRGNFPAGHLSPLDYQADITDQIANGWASDFSTTRLCREDKGIMEHFRGLAVALDVDTIILEHPFLWPIVEKLKQDPRFHHVKVVYSSHNIESQVKIRVLESVGLATELVDDISEGINDLEREVIGSSDLVIACTSADAALYREWWPQKQIVVLRNGIDAPNDRAVGSPPIDGKYLAFVGSAHIPNCTGFVDCVLGEGLQFLPRHKQLVIAGGVAELLQENLKYKLRHQSNAHRIEFRHDPTDDELAAIIGHAHGVLLPIKDGGGSNLKTAEALMSGKWVIGTPKAFRSFEEYVGEPGVVIAETHADFVNAIREVFSRPALSLDTAQLAYRENVTWRSILKDFVLEDYL